LWVGAVVMWLALGIWHIAAAALLIHMIEMPLAALPRARRAGVARWRAAALTMIFGFVWWRRL
jgi:hypothetical protein